MAAVGTELPSIVIRRDGRSRRRSRNCHPTFSRIDQDTDSESETPPPIIVATRNPDVQTKAAAASKWCKTANAHVSAGNGRPWSYALLPDDQIAGVATLDGLMSRFGQ